jgi:hypothetical protein
MLEMSSDILTGYAILKVFWNALVSLSAPHKVQAAIFVDGVEIVDSLRVGGIDSANTTLVGTMEVTLSGLSEIEVDPGIHVVEIRWKNEAGFNASTVGLSRVLQVEDIGGTIGSFFIG